MTSNLIVMALQQECRGMFDNENIIYTGLGKVNATYQLTKAIVSHKPKLVINLGSAGSQVFKAGTLVNCVSFIQRDMNVEPLGFEKWQTPFEEDNQPILKYGQRIEHLSEGICGTGDSFDTSNTTEIYNVVDMEAYALAKVCKLEQIPFVCIKYISDGADGTAANDWQTKLDDASKRLFEEYLVSFIGKLNPDSSKFY